MNLSIICLVVLVFSAIDAPGGEHAYYLIGVKKPYEYDFRPRELLKVPNGAPSISLWKATGSATASGAQTTNLIREVFESKGRVSLLILVNRSDALVFCFPATKNPAKPIFIRGLNPRREFRLVNHWELEFGRTNKPGENRVFFNEAGKIIKDTRYNKYFPDELYRRPDNQDFPLTYYVAGVCSSNEMRPEELFQETRMGVRTSLWKETNNPSDPVWLTTRYIGAVFETEGTVSLLVQINASDLIVASFPAKTNAVKPVFVRGIFTVENPAQPVCSVKPGEIEFGIINKPGENRVFFNEDGRIIKDTRSKSYRGD